MSTLVCHGSVSRAFGGVPIELDTRSLRDLVWPRDGERAAAGHEAAQRAREHLRSEVRRFMAAQRQEQIDDTNRLHWRDALVEAARSSPDDEWTAEALLQAGYLSDDEPEVQEHLLRSGIEHPLVEPTGKIMALRTVSRLAAYRRGDLVQAFADYNAIVETIEVLEPADLYMDWQPESYRVLLDKAMLLDTWRELRRSIPQLPASDAGKRASVYYRACLDLPTDVRIRAGIGPDTDLLQAYAAALAGEGQRDEAARVYRELRAHPENPYPPSFICYLEAQALYPDGGPAFREALERAERELPPDGFSRMLSMHIAFLHYIRGMPQACIDRVEPLLTSEDPADRAFVADPVLRENMLVWLAECYARRGVTNHEKSAVYYEQLLAEFPDYPHASIVYSQLARVYAYQLGDFERAAEYCRRLLREFPGDINESSTSVLLRHACDRIDAKTAGSAGESEGERP